MAYISGVDGFEKPKKESKEAKAKEETPLEHDIKEVKSNNPIEPVHQFWRKKK
jgi:hypothetical protein